MLDFGFFPPEIENPAKTEKRIILYSFVVKSYFDHCSIIFKSIMRFTMSN